MSNILIAGSAGFVGSSLTNYMIQYSKYGVASADNLKNNDLRGLATAMAATTRHQFYLLDLKDEYFVNRMIEIEKPKCIIFNALTGSIDAIKLHTMIKACLATPSVKKLIVISKDLYDNCPASNFIEWDLEPENNVYWNLMREAGKSLYFIKACEILGPRQLPGSFIPDVILSLMDGKQVEATDEKPREWIYTRDFYIRVASLIESTAESGTYRIFSGQQASKKDICAYLDRIITGSEAPYQFRSVIPDQGVPGDKHFLPLRKMGFGPPENSLESALQHIACWYRDNRRTWSI